MRALLSERIKMRHTWLAPLAAIGPLGVIGLIVILWNLQHDWLHQRVAEQGAWSAVIGEMGMLEIGAITLGAAILASLIFDLDHRAEGWKQLFALPVSRTGIYLAKVAGVAALLLGSSILMVLGVITMWLWQDLGALPWRDLGLLVIVPWVGVLPVIAVQSALSAHIRNQAFPMILGVSGAVLSLFLSVDRLPDWIPWLMTPQAMEWVVKGEGDIWRTITIAVGTALAVSVAGAVAYSRRDVK